MAVRMRPVLAREAQVSMLGSLLWSAFQAPARTALVSMVIRGHKYALQMVRVSIIVFVKIYPIFVRRAQPLRVPVPMETQGTRSAVKMDKPTIHAHAVRLPKYVRPEQHRPVSAQMGERALNRAKTMVWL
jgi:hypothetical protein